MKTIEEKIKFYKESLDIFDDGMDKYKFLIDQAKNADEFPDFLKHLAGCNIPRIQRNFYLANLEKYHTEHQT